MGVVYEGFDPIIERAVAIKTIQKSLIDQSEVDEVLARFRREAQAAGRLTHPNIVSVYEYGEEGDVAFIAMELLAGKEIKEYFEKARRFQLSECASIMFQLLRALEYSHSHGVVHRDIKPSNILITEDGQIKIADFGIARIESSDLTQVGTVLGTPSYMSPEQFTGRTADRRSDIYSAGVILYQLLTGERPFTGSNMTTIMHKVMYQAPVPPGKLNPLVSKAIDVVVKKAMAKSREDRFQTAADFMAALEKAMAPFKPSVGIPDSEATIKLAAQDSLHGGSDQDVTIHINMEDFEKRLEDTQRMVSYATRQSVLSKELQEAGSTVAITPVVPAGLQQEVQQAPTESGLLARLALEAKEKLGTRQSLDQEKQARNRRVHNSLEFILKFLIPFVRHTNNVEPAINRTYSLDARTVFANLKWGGAIVYSRKQSLAEEACLAYVMFKVNLCAPKPVLIKLPLDQLDKLKKELNYLRIRALDDLEEIHKRPKQGWLQARLDPAIPAQIVFQGDYENGKVSIITHNVGDFGHAEFSLKPEDITPALMDDLGLFLIGRTNKLPALLQPGRLMQRPTSRK
jgi:serine/threonine protein kinase